MRGLKERIREHFDPNRARGMAVPEWGEDGKPLALTWMPVTVADNAAASAAGCEIWSYRACFLVAHKACDADGNRLFSTIDHLELRQIAHPGVINRIAMTMIAELTVDEAAGN